MAEVCAQIDAVEAAADNRIGGPPAGYGRALSTLEAQLSGRPADSLEVARWRQRRLSRAVLNDWRADLIEPLALAVERDRKRWKGTGLGTRARFAEEENLMSDAPPVATPVGKLAYTIPEAIEATAIGRTSLYADIAAGRLETRKRGSRTIILADELRRYLADLPSSN